MTADYPVASPLFVSCLADEIVAARAAAGPKPKAHDTLFRYSRAGSCARLLAMDAAGIAETNPMDECGAWVTFLGTLIHEHVQAAIERRFPGAQAEVTSVIVEASVSGSADEVIPPVEALAVVGWEGGKVLFELKTIGGTGFSQAIGVNRKAYKRDTPKGPRVSAKRQAALNAYANECDTVVVGYLATEAISKGLAEKLGLSDRDRYCAEWWYSREDWEPLAKEEIRRMGAVKALLEEGVIADRWAVEDDGTQKLLNPELARPDWKCLYCGHFDVCKTVGPGEVPLDQLTGREILWNPKQPNNKLSISKD
jgi:hypothetical protein